MKTIRVEAVYRLHGTASMKVSENVSLEYVIALLGHEPRLRVVFLVDTAKKFSGVITNIDLIRWAHIELFGGKGRHEIETSELYRIADAKKAKVPLTTSFDPPVTM